MLLLHSAKEGCREKLEELFDGIQWKKKDIYGEWYLSKTHKDIWSLIEDAQNKGYLTEESLRNTIRLSLVIFDLFKLLDNDNDGKLWRFNISPQIELKSPDIEELFETFLKELNFSKE